LGAAVVAQTWSYFIEFDRRTQEIRKYEQGTVQLIISTFLQSTGFPVVRNRCEMAAMQASILVQLESAKLMADGFSFYDLSEVRCFQRKFLCAMHDLGHGIGNF
jgi:hypothetical protein